MAQAQEEVRFISQNQVSIIGSLVSLNVEDKVSEKVGAMKFGSLKVRTGEGEVHNVRFMQMKNFNNDPEKENKQYKALETIESEYISEEDTKDSNSEHFGKEATKIVVSGSLEPNVFKIKDGTEVESVGISARFINRLQNPEDEPKATVRLSGFVHTDPVAEVGKDGEETGRYKVTIKGIDYKNKAFSVEFVAGMVKDPDSEEEFDAGEWLEGNLEKGQTVTVDADIINRYIVEKVRRDNDGGFGKMTDTKRDIQQEYRLFACDSPLHFDDFDEDEPADKERVVFPSQMEESLKNYEQYKADRLAASGKSKSSGSAKKRGASSFGGSETKTEKKAGKSKVSNSDLPF